MIRINMLLTPGKIIRADLEHKPIMGAFIEAALLAGGIEIKWEYDFKWDEEGFLRSTGKQYVGAREVGPCTERPPLSERREQQV